MSASTSGCEFSDGHRTVAVAELPLSDIYDIGVHQGIDDGSPERIGP